MKGDHSKPTEIVRIPSWTRRQNIESTTPTTIHVSDGNKMAKHYFTIHIRKHIKEKALRNRKKLRERQPRQNDNRIRLNPLFFHLGSINITRHPVHKFRMTTNRNINPALMAASLRFKER